MASRNAIMTAKTPPALSFSVRLTRSLGGRWRSLRAHPLLNPVGLGELLRERQGGHPADPDHRPHLQEAVDWICRAQDATPDDGIARGYSRLLTPGGLGELLRERQGARPAEPDHRPHRQEAVDWICRAQDATPDDGIARGYSVLYSPYFRSRGWQPSYPETTGYL